jgi:large subunit ribosomal protein L25
MNEYVIKAQKREASGKSAVKQLRRAGRIPGVCYGAGEATIHFSVAQKDILDILHRKQDNVIINLDMEGQKYLTLIRELQVNNLHDELLHLDMSHISMTQKIEVDVHIQLTGVAVGVKDEGGVLSQVLRAVKVRCLPTDIPESLSVSVDALKMGDSVRIKDMPVDTTKLEVLAEPNMVIAAVTHAISEEDLKLQLDEKVGEPEVVAEAATEEGAAAVEGEAKPGEKADEAKPGEKAAEAKPGEKPGKPAAGDKGDKPAAGGKKPEKK